MSTGRDLIELRGLRVTGTHGVLREERLRAQPFEVDLDIEANLAAAGASDDLADTVDYAAVTDVVAKIVSGPHADLMEHLALRIADAVLAAPHVEAVTVRLRKLRPPVAHDLASAGVQIHRRRGGSRGGV